LRRCRSRFGIPVSDEEIAEAPFYRPTDDSQEIQYIHRQRERLGGYVPRRTVAVESMKAPGGGVFDEVNTGTEGREASTTMVFVRIRGKLVGGGELGRLIVRIVRGEARSLGTDS